MSEHRPPHGGYPGTVRPTAQPGLTVWGIPVTLDERLPPGAPPILVSGGDVAGVVDELVREAKLADRTPVEVSVRTIAGAADVPRRMLERAQAKREAALSTLTPETRERLEAAERAADAAALGIPTDKSPLSPDRRLSQDLDRG